MIDGLLPFPGGSGYDCPISWRRLILIVDRVLGEEGSTCGFGLLRFYESSQEDGVCGIDCFGQERGLFQIEYL